MSTNFKNTGSVTLGELDDLRYFVEELNGIDFITNLSSLIDEYLNHQGDIYVISNVAMDAIKIHSLIQWLSQSINTLIKEKFNKENSTDY